MYYIVLLSLVFYVNVLHCVVVLGVCIFFVMVVFVCLFFLFLIFYFGPAVPLYILVSST